MTKIDRRGLMLILSSPSGAGKTTIAKKLLREDEHLVTSTSCTTREKRHNEVDGKDYNFISITEFNRMIKDNEFLEYAEVFGHYYGTPKRVVEGYLREGVDVIFDIDWQGNKALTSKARDDVVSVFVLPPSMEELYRRLRMRKADSEEVMKFRMERAGSEISHWHEYDYTIINHDLDQSMEKIFAILRAERLKKARRLGVPGFVDNLLKEKVEL